ncbi:WD40 repeat-like protein [Aspergillus heteromorphus CBS 117.55]|uniref:WD40 repeat-like protein n=1 Tax=Aspergillus heteromorphus CBS 117.55 TaxID=1448321 RepID=A0A317V2W4_9EURO|nr:WD40 repeat-like protein [Aspergillus heteromorphus CBS 117.55]PWY68425.1 WD40 repeat-like protein [Aspergillus heteromorphus CBS 117.55]
MVEKLSPICVATTHSNRHDTHKPGTKRQPSSCHDADKKVEDTKHSVKEICSATYFKSAEWSADGTTIVTDSADHHVRTWILPQDLLEEKPSPHELSPYSTLPSVEPTYATAMYPFFSLQDPSTTLLLSSIRDHPIRLSSVLAPTSLATYSLVNPMTEAFITPHSMLYPSALGGTHFLTGSDSLICLFDVSRPGNDGPIASMPTIPSKRKQMVGGGVGMKGIVSAMSMDPTGGGILAAGTFTRHVGLYGSHGTGESLGTFSIAKTEAQRHIDGRGVTQLLWSPCGRYLYVAERKSDGVLIYDIRVTGQLLGWLQGRRALTNQRMKIDVVPSGEGGSHEIWAGGTDGCMRVWKNPTHSVGAQDPKWEWKIHDGSVSSTVLHPLGTIAATTSGQKSYENDDNNSGDPTPAPDGDNSLKIWHMPFLSDNGEND